jgi:thymidylate synthase
VEYIHHIRNAHIYQTQEELSRPMLDRVALPLATLTLNKAGLAATDIHEFSSKLFELSDYEPHPSIPKIPVLT